ncbi:MAG: M48 family metalloprotease [Gammaproteobacteria bacterium]|nr:M48 family metalloprotease [Gammaproteobacteria bacterium]
MLRFLACLILATACGAAAAQGSDLPDFGSLADSVITRSQEARLGRSIVAQLRNAGAVMDDPQLTEYIQSLGARLAGQASDGKQDFEFFIVDDSAINAFALPGGYIGVNSGLILASDSESELAGVLAHEVAHVTQRHIARSMYDSQRSGMLSIATMLAAILLSAAADMSGDVTAGLITASQAATAQRQINYTRSNEREADRIGMDTLSSAGFDPTGMSSFFEKLSRRFGSASRQIPAFLQTHPVTTERIADARDRVRQLPSVEVNDSRSYSIIKARMRALQAPTPEAAYAIFSTRLENGSSAPADRYGLALSLSRLGRDDEAERMFREFVEESPGIIPYRIGHGETLMRNGQIDAALDSFSEAVSLFPRNVPLTISFAEALILAGDPAAAHQLLLDLLNNVPPTPEQIRLIARAANAEGDVGNAHFYMAEYYVGIGSAPLAVNQLRMALESPNVNSVDRSRIEARLEQILEFMPEGERRRGRDTAGRQLARTAPQ